MITAPAFADLKRYLDVDPSDLRRFELAAQLASLFDEYLIYRHDLCLDFERGAAPEDWQAQLWRAVAEGVESAHRARLLSDFEQVITAGAPPVVPLPPAVSLFGIGSLAPMQVRMLGALAQHTEVALYYLNPCREYWADVEDERRLARRRARAKRASLPDPTGMLDIGNPLLASLGHAGQVFLDQLLELGGADSEHFLEPAGDSLLACLQRDLLNLTDRRCAVATARTEIRPDDLSLRVHGAHGPLREVQVLHDRLLDLVENLPGLEPRDIIVMAPDIDLYAPYVEAVFGAGSDTEPATPRIPWTLADRKPGAGQSLVEAIKRLLALHQSRLAASEVLAWLAVPALRRRFGLSESSRERLVGWISDAGIRWGLNADSRKDLGLPAEPLNTWAFGLERLFLGAAMPPEWADRPYLGARPYADIDPGEVEILGALQSLIDGLTQWRRRLMQVRTGAEWITAINALLETFFDAEEDEEIALLDAVRAAVEQMLTSQRLAGVEEPISIDLVSALIRQALDEPDGAHGFLTGRVTFTNMVPMRSIPHRVVAILGLEADAFPRSQRPLSFDRIASAPRRGDRSRRRDDRYLFLECLLAARDAVHLSWSAHGPRDNSPRACSVVVDELLDYIDAAFRLAGAALPRERLVVHHPLQPFSPAHFDGAQPAVASYSRRWCEAARALGENVIAPFIAQPLAEPEASWREVGLGDLLGFLRDPSGYFLRKRLGLRLPRSEDAPCDDEPFMVGTGLERYGIRTALLDSRQAGQGDNDILAGLRAEGILPHGTFGEQQTRQELELVDDLIARQAHWMGEPLDPLDVDLTIGAFRLHGELRPLTDAGLVLARPAKIKAKDRLVAWVNHLVLCVAAPKGVKPSTAAIAEDVTLVFDAVQQPRDLLSDLLALYWEGLSRPLPFFPATSFAWFEQQTDAAVADSWDGGYYAEGEGNDLAVRMAFRGQDPLADPFKDLAMRVYGPMAAVSRQINAGEEFEAV